MKYLYQITKVQLKPKNLYQNNNNKIIVLVNVMMKYLPVYQITTPPTQTNTDIQSKINEPYWFV